MPAADKVHDCELKAVTLTNKFARQLCANFFYSYSVECSIREIQLGHTKQTNGHLAEEELVKLTAAEGSEHGSSAVVFPIN